MKHLGWLMVLVLGMGLSGCAEIMGESDYIPYTEALGTHSTAEGNRISTQSQAIANVMLTAKTDTKTEGALLAVIAMMQIQSLHPVALNIQKPTTGYDVLNRHLGSIISTGVSAATSYFAWDTVSDIVKGSGNVFYGDVSADGSFNTSEIHSTGSEYSDITTADTDDHSIPTTTTTTTTDDHSGASDDTGVN